MTQQQAVAINKGDQVEVNAIAEFHPYGIRLVGGRPGHQLYDVHRRTWRAPPLGSFYATTYSVTIAGKRYRSKETLYYFPDRTFVAGNHIKDFKRLPRGVRIFLPAKS